jgi:hypothetical protein
MIWCVTEYDIEIYMISYMISYQILYDIAHTDIANDIIVLD